MLASLESSDHPCRLSTPHLLVGALPSIHIDLHSTHGLVGSVRILRRLFALIPCSNGAFLPPSNEIVASMKQKEVTDGEIREQRYNHYLQNVGVQLTVLFKYVVHFVS